MLVLSNIERTVHSLSPWKLLIQSSSMHWTLKNWLSFCVKLKIMGLIKHHRDVFTLPIMPMLCPTLGYGVHLWLWRASQISRASLQFWVNPFVIAFHYVTLSVSTTVWGVCVYLLCGASVYQCVCVHLLCGASMCVRAPAVWLVYVCACTCCVGRQCVCVHLLCGASMCVRAPAVWGVYVCAFTCCVGRLCVSVRVCAPAVWSV